MEVVLTSPIGQRILGFSPISIGRAPTNQIILAHDNQVSGKHADIAPTGQGYTLTDLGSTNGTFVNGQRLAPHIPYVLKLHDTIKIGQTSFTFEMSSPPARQSNSVPSQPSQPRQQSSSQQPWTQYPQQNWSPQYIAPPPPPPQYPPYYVQPPMPLMMFQQSSFQTINVRQSQYGCLVRMLYFICIGWWLGLMWAVLALVLCITIIGAPIGFVMLNQLPTVLTMQQQ